MEWSNKERRMSALIARVMEMLRPQGMPTPIPVRLAEVTPYQRRKAYCHHPGRPGVEPTRFGDWEYNGRCTDFS